MFCPKRSEDQKKVITFADAQFWDMKILGGCCRIIGRDASLHGFAPMVMKRFEIIEKLYLSKALLKMAGGGDASPTSPLWLRACLGMYALGAYTAFSR